MFGSLRSPAAALLSLLALLPAVCAHAVITYPGWRGDNLLSNGSFSESNGIAGGPMNVYPGGMQWSYPCGGLGTSTNRTNWPVSGGAIAFQPGWFQGHQYALVYINLGEGTQPKNWSLPMVPVFQIQGPSNDPYPNLGICLPQVPLPANYNAKVGDNATIQIVMAAQHGAALYSCVDITFAEPSEVAEVNGTNCGNATEIGFNMVITTRRMTAGASSTLARSTTPWLAWIPMAMALFLAFQL